MFNFPPPPLFVGFLTKKVFFIVFGHKLLIYQFKREKGFMTGYVQSKRALICRRLRKFLLAKRHKIFNHVNVYFISVKWTPLTLTLNLTPPPKCRCQLHNALYAISLRPSNIQNTGYFLSNRPTEGRDYSKVFFNKTISKKGIIFFEKRSLTV